MTNKFIKTLSNVSAPEYAIIGIVLLMIVISLSLMTYFCCKKFKNQQTVDELPTLSDSDTELSYSGSPQNRDNDDDDDDNDNDHDEKSKINIKIAKLSTPKHINFDVKYISVNIRTPYSSASGNKKPLKVLNSLTIGMLKNLISKYYNISERKQEIHFKHIRCNSQWKIGDYNIKDGDDIIVNINDNHNGNELKITLQYKLNIKRIVYCDANDTLKTFKREVYGKFPSVPISQQQFVYNGVELKDENLTMQEYGLKNDAVVIFDWKEKSKSKYML